MRSGCWLALVLAGCSSEEPPPADDAPRVAMLLEVFEVTPSGQGDRVEGAEVCVTEPDLGCQLTDGAGEVLFEGLVALAPMAATASKKGYVTSVAHTLAPDRDSVFVAQLVGDATATALAALIGQPWPTPDLGLINFLTQDTPGVTVTLEPEVGRGPYYFDDDGIPDDTLTGTTSQGSGFYSELPPGEYVLTFAGCSAIEFGLPGPSTAAARTYAMGGAITFVGAICP